MVEAVLRINPALAELSEEDLIRVAAHMDELSVVMGTEVIQEGGSDRAFYVILSGEVSFRRHRMLLGTGAAGEHFGELGLIAGRPRAVTVVARSDLRLARLGLGGYEQLSAEHPSVALRLVGALVDALGGRLVEMNERLGNLLQERSLPRRARIEVRVGDTTHVAHMGARVRAFLPAEVDGEPVIAALVDRRGVSLDAQLSADCSVEPVSTAHWEGRRIYRASLALLLLEAANAHDPSLDLRMEHSVGFAQRVAVVSTSENLGTLAAALQQRMQERVDQNVALREEWWTVAEARDHFLRVGWSDARALLLLWRDPAVMMHTYGDVYAVSTGPLVPDAGLLGGFKVVSDEGGLLLVYGEWGTASEAEIPDDEGMLHAAARTVSRHAGAMLREHARWLETLEVGSVGEFNAFCLRGEVSQVIRVAEGFHEKRIGRIADEVCARADAIKVVCISGPSSSGKSTFINRLKVQLQVTGVRPVVLSLDNYYVDRDDTPRDADGEYDFESFEALHHELLQNHLTRLLAGEAVQTARFDFSAGRSYPAGGPSIALGERDVLMLEGIHGLNPGLLPHLGGDVVYRVFVCPLAQLPFDRVTRVHASDVRLVRRIVRDRHARGATAAQTIARWPSVRRGERRHIFPFQGHADAVFDSSLIYELSVLKVYAERYLLEVPQDDPAYATAFRLLQLTDRFVTIYPDHVPPVSLLREFVGGSSFGPHAS